MLPAQITGDIFKLDTDTARNRIEQYDKPLEGDPDNVNKTQDIPNVSLPNPGKPIVHNRKYDTSIKKGFYNYCKDRNLSTTTLAKIARYYKIWDF